MSMEIVFPGGKIVLWYLLFYHRFSNLNSIYQGNVAQTLRSALQHNCSGRACSTVVQTFRSAYPGKSKGLHYILPGLKA